MGSPEKSSGGGGDGGSVPSDKSATGSAAAAGAVAVASASDWSKSVPAYYSPAAVLPPQAFYSPHATWSAQQLMAAYGGPAIAYAPFYAQPGPGMMYAQHPLPVGVAYPTAGLEGKGDAEKARNDGKGISGSHDDAARSGDSDTVGSSDTRENVSKDKNQSASKKRTYDMVSVEAESTNPTTAGQYAGAESSYSGRTRVVQKLPVSAPGRSALPDPQTNLSIGMDLWNLPQGGPASVKDERELKRERRKQSNRESARRSRLRKQQECEDLAKKVSELSNENNALRVEVEHLKKVCDDLSTENKSLEDELTQQYGPNFLLVLGVDANPSNNGHLHGNLLGNQKNDTSGDNPGSTSS